MFRPGSHNPHTVYWSGPDGGPDRFVATAMTPEAAVGIAGLLNSVPGMGEPAFLATLPMVAKIEPKVPVTLRVTDSGALGVELMRLIRDGRLRFES